MKVAKAYFWPRWFYDSLSIKEQKAIPKNLIKKLQCANLYLWRALNIYDDFLDGSGQPKKLPEANNCFRKFLEIYYRQNFAPDFYLLFDKVLADLEDANRQEALEQLKENKSIKNNQLSALRNLSRKSLALGLGPLAILAYGGEKVTSPKFQATLNFFRSALAAKQLSDDARDWREDLTAGKITAVNAPIKELFSQKNKGFSPITDYTKANLCFALKVAPKLITNIARLTSRARQELSKAGLEKNNRLADSILSPLELGVSETTTFLHLLRQKP